MKKIKLTQGEYALVDDEDFEYLNQWKWFLKSSGYVIRTQRFGERKYNKSKKIYMHRLINNTPEDLQTDHLDRNKLNNQKMNLRSVTNQQNCINKGLQKNNTSGYKGICWLTQNNKWRVRIKVNGKEIPLGCYSTIQGAWLARRWGERLYFGGPVQ